MSRSTTTTNSAKSPVYCAPEVASFETRNFSSDIWSLGCVFLEMTTILKGQTITQMRQSFKGYPEDFCFFASIRSVNLWIEKLYSLGSNRDDEPLKWIKLMLNVHLLHRPIAETLFNMITNQGANSDSSFHPARFCGLCCAEDDELSFYSESDGELWAEEPEAEQTMHPHSLPINLHPAQAQVDQHSAMLEINTHQRQDPDRGSTDTLSKNMFPDCDNNDDERLSTSMEIELQTQAADVPRNALNFPGGDNNDGGEISSPWNPVDYVKPIDGVNSFDCVVPGCNNNRGKGFETFFTINRHFRSVHSSQKYDCTFPDCDDN